MKKNEKPEKRINLKSHILKNGNKMIEWLKR